MTLHLLFPSHDQHEMHSDTKQKTRTLIRKHKTQKAGLHKPGGKGASTSVIPHVPHKTRLTSETDTAHDVELLQDEMAHLRDNLAMVTIMLQSLISAYSTSQLANTQPTTRLSAMEKELLAAYDHLTLQVKRLERQIAFLDNRLKQLRPLLNEATVSHAVSPDQSINSPCYTTPALGTDAHLPTSASESLVPNQYTPPTTAHDSPFELLTPDFNATHVDPPLGCNTASPPAEYLICTCQECPGLYPYQSPFSLSV